MSKDGVRSLYRSHKKMSLFSFVHDMKLTTEPFMLKLRPLFAVFARSVGVPDCNKKSSIRALPKSVSH